jgi:hypothetical protein
VDIPKSLALPLDKNPLVLKKLSLFPGHLEFKHNNYSYDDVFLLAFDLHAFLRVTRGSIESVKLEFKLRKYPKKVKVVIGPTAVGFNFNMSKFINLYSVWDYLAKKSFAARYGYYKSMYDRNGFFEYLNYKYSKDRLLFDDGKEIVIGNHIYLQRNNWGINLLDRTKTASSLIILPENTVAFIPFKYDWDVFEKLLHEVSGITYD